METWESQGKPANRVYMENGVCVSGIESVEFVFMSFVGFFSVILDTRSRVIKK